MPPVRMTRAEYEAKYGVTPKATTTAPVKMTRAEYEAKYGVKPSTPAPTAPEKKPGIFQSIVQGVAKLPLKVGSGIVAPAIDALSGYSMAEIKKRNSEGRDFGYFGKVGTLGGALTDPTKTPGQQAAGGLKDLVGSGFEAASYLVPVSKAPALINATRGGRVLAGIGTGAKAGAMGGALGAGGSELTKEESTLGSVAARTSTGAAGGAVFGGAFGAIAPAVGKTVNTAKSVKSGDTSASIMQRVARTNALDQEKFKKAAGESVGDYLVKRGIYGTDDEITVKLADRFVQSKQVADEAIAQLPGQHKSGAIDDILDELLGREQRISTKNVPSKELAIVEGMKAKNDAGGLTMTEINALKRMYERNVKLGYLKENNTEAVARATNLDDTLREWQFAKATELGLTNLKEINRETRLARQLGDALVKKMSRSEGNNAFGLTDAILLSGGDPQAITMLLTKKTFGSKGVQSAIAKKLAPNASIGLPTAKYAPTQGSATQ